MLHRFFHYLCMLLLLAAQQGALVHATWHAGGAAHDVQVRQGHAHDYTGSDHELPLGQGKLCAFDFAFGQVLGGVQGSCAPSVTAELPVAVAGYIGNPRLDAEAVHALARGPPVLL